MSKITHFFDALLGQRVPMRFDFGRAMTMRHEAELLATPIAPAGDDWTKATLADNAPEPMLPDGVSESGGRYFTDCCCCGRACDVSEWIGTEETKDIDFEDWYGCCGPQCCR